MLDDECQQGSVGPVRSGPGEIGGHACMDEMILKGGGDCVY